MTVKELQDNDAQRQAQYHEEYKRKVRQRKAQETLRRAYIECQGGPDYTNARKEEG